MGFFDDFGKGFQKGFEAPFKFGINVTKDLAKQTGIPQTIANLGGGIINKAGDIIDSGIDILGGFTKWLPLIIIAIGGVIVIKMVKD